MKKNFFFSKKDDQNNDFIINENIDYTILDQNKKNINLETINPNQINNFDQSANPKETSNLNNITINKKAINQEINTTSNDNYQKIENELPSHSKPKLKNKKLLIIIITIIITFIALITFIILYFVIDGKLTKLEIKSDNIIYVGEKTNISTKAIGKRNLKNTKMTYTLSNYEMASLEKNTINGAITNNNIIANESGKITINVTGNLKNNKANASKEIVICKRFNEEAIAKENITLDLGSSIILKLDLGTETECYNNITYNINDESIAIIDSYGRMTGRKIGITTMSISNGTTTIIVNLNVIDPIKKINVTGIKTEISSLELKVGEEKKLNATTIPSNATNQNIRWQSSNPKTAIITNSGIIKGLKAGNTTIIATTEDGKFESKINVTVIK